MKDIAVIILAAGMGKRMRSAIPKVLHLIAGMPMALYPIEVAKSVGVKKIIVVVGHEGEKVIATLNSQLSILKYVTQEPQLGTGHAVMCAESVLKGFKGDILILSGDVPLITKETIKDLLRNHKKSNAVLSFISTTIPIPTGYGRVCRDKDDSVIKIVEDKDADNEERKNREINTGIYCVSKEFLFSNLKKIKNKNRQGEYYLPDLIEMAVRQGRKVSTLVHTSPEEVLGINNRIELAEANEEMRERLNNEFMLSGVTLIDPEAAYIHKTVKIGMDTVIYPCVFLEGSTQIGKNCIIEHGCKIVNSRIGDNSRIKNFSVIENSVIGKDVSIGPFARLRPETIVEDNAKIGNFVEVKKTRLGKGSKANHLSYLGDAIIGKDVNIGAGTITCNYDGIKKHQTIIEDNAFIGSDTQLVAPVKVGRNAYVGSGSTITKDVPKDALALSRVQQRNIKGWVKKKGLEKKSE
ncbi:MAG: bifunctional UDP-N-acetylglucosamine diphosphorylase/glucosamine-1-phosphate N-acetyltransferase GlmU [Deltaproteobacteria bacterium]|nr:bifunctional UDP-N-acetylglucosamine diphosphorylase/glucosamine-1-phosphate N-acetyltransferase GlmU [Deltaproteobacteria bacterium]